MAEIKDENHGLIPRRRFLLLAGGLIALAADQACSTRENVDKVFSKDPIHHLEQEDNIGIDTARESDFVSETDEANKLIVDSRSSQGIVEELVKVEGRKWLGQLKGNGERDTIIFIPEGANIDKPFELIYHFHGTNGHLINEVMPRFKGMSDYYKEHKAGKISVAANRLQQVFRAGSELGSDPKRNVIIVYPISAGGRGSGFAIRNGYDDAWMRTGNNTDDDINKLHFEVLEVLVSEYGMDPQIASITIKGHSAGGAPLRNIAESGFQLNRVDFLDASYARWAQECQRYAIKTNPDFKINIFYRPDTETDRRSRGAEKLKGVTRIRTKTPHRNMNQELFGWNRTDISPTPNY